jgi:DNA repair protein RadC
MRKQNAEKPSVENRFDALKLAALNKAEKDAVIKLALSVLKDRHRAGRALGSPGDTRAYLRLKLAERKNEVFGSLFLDTRNRIIEDVELFHGTIDGASVHPRVVVQRALQSNAGSVVLYHNHPSGVAEPSHADEAITRRLRDALSLVDVRVLDHFVVAAGDSVSFAEKGLL